jgi:hypothetical protein
MGSAGQFMVYAIEKNLTADSLTDALLFQGQQCNSIGAVKLSAVRFFSIGYSNIKYLLSFARSQEQVALQSGNTFVGE